MSLLDVRQQNHNQANPQGLAGLHSVSEREKSCEREGCIQGGGEVGVQWGSPFVTYPIRNCSAGKANETTCKYPTKVINLSKLHANIALTNTENKVCC